MDEATKLAQLRAYLRGRGLRPTPLVMAYASMVMAQGFSPKAAARYTRLELVDNNLA